MDEHLLQKYVCMLYIILSTKVFFGTQVEDMIWITCCIIYMYDFKACHKNVDNQRESVTVGTTFSAGNFHSVYLSNKLININPAHFICMYI